MNTLRQALATLLLSLICLFCSTAAQAAAPVDHTDPKMRENGMKAAPALIEQLKLPCELADARDVGPATVKKSGKDIKGEAYEVNCKSNQGFFLIALKDGTQATPMNCNQADAIRAKDKTASTCQLPGNKGNAYWLTPFAKTRTPWCNVNRARWLSPNAKGDKVFYELNCKDNIPGIYEIPNYDAADQTVGYLSCIKTEDTAMKCEFAAHADTVKYLAPMVKKLSASCEIAEARYIGQSGDNDYYEIGCGDKPGFIMALGPQDTPKNTYACDQAQKLGGCKFTDAAAVAAARKTQAEAQKTQANASMAAYTDVLTKASITCTIADVVKIGKQTDTGRDVVEFKCPERPLGLLALIPPAGNSAPFESYDCFGARMIGTQCRFVSDADMMAHLQTLLAGHKTVKADCQLSQVRYAFMGKTGSIVLELACVNKRGYIGVLNTARAAINPAVPCHIAATSDKVPEKCTIKDNGSHIAD